MDEKEAIALKKLYRHHIRQIKRPAVFIRKVLFGGVFPTEYSNTLPADIKRGGNESLLKQLMKDLPKYCSAKKFSEFLKQNYHSLYKRFEKRLKHSSTVNRVLHVVPSSHSPSNRNNRFIQDFYQQLKARTLLDGDLHWKHDLNDWSVRLMKLLESQQLFPLCEKTKVADCAFVLLDLIAVLEKQHERNKSTLWCSQVYGNMEKVMIHTSDPTLSRLCYYGRKGTALAQANHQDAMAYAECVLESSHLFTRGKQIGSSIFAVVNIFLQKYASMDQNELSSSSGQRFKKEILYWIDKGIEHFEDEDDEIRRTWRRVYLDKKIYCYLGIDILSQDIPGVPITGDDITAAKQHIDELEYLREGMESLRRVHLNVARGKLHAIRDERHASEGFYKEALDTAEKYNLNAEISVITCRIGPAQQIDTARQSTRGFSGSHVIYTCREPSESSDVEMQSFEKQSDKNVHETDSCSTHESKDGDGKNASISSLRPFHDIHKRDDTFSNKTNLSDGTQMVTDCVVSLTAKLSLSTTSPTAGDPVENDDKCSSKIFFWGGK